MALAGTEIESASGMAPDPSVHPKLTWKAWLRHLLFSLVTTLGLFVVMGALWLGVMLFIIPGVCFPPPKRDTAEHDIESIHNALKLYSAKTGRVPTTGGMRALVNSGIIERFPYDPWGMPYQYEFRDGRPVVWSYGADGAPGGEEADADIFGRERK